MIRNNFTTAFRSLLKNKGFTVINVLGLALGLATGLLIVFYVFDELSYDRYHTHADRIYRINTDINFGGTETSNATAPAPLFAALKNDFPEIEKVVRFGVRGGFQVRKGDHHMQEDKMVYADSTLFNVFTLAMISGSPATALAEPHSVVITESTAEKYFNSTNVVGKAFTFNDTAQYKITGVIKNIPKQSHFNFDFFISMATLAESRQDIWLYNNFNTYVLLKPGADYKKLEAKFPDFLRKHAGPQLQAMVGITFDQFEQSGNYFRINLTPLKKIHLESNRVSELAPNGNIEYVYIFSAIALFILLIACVNFMNLSTACSSNRAREVGVRKVLGSPRKYLIAQFLTESIIVTLVGAIIAVFAAWELLPIFNHLVGKELTLTSQIIFLLLPALLVFTIIIGCLAGSYPALFLSAFRPIDVLKGKLAAGFEGNRLRSFLVVFQFSIAIFLIIGTLVIYNQLKYIQSKDLGYNRDQVLIVQNVSTLGNKAKTFKNEVKRLAGVRSVSLTGYLPTSAYGNSIPIPLFKEAVLDQKKAIKSQIWNVDEDYIPTLGIKMVAGRNFSKLMPTDSSKMIINEAAAKLLGFSNPLNQELYEPQDNMVHSLKAFRIVGVMKNFNFKSLRENVTPLILILSEDKGALSIRVKAANIPTLLAQVKSKWTEISPNQPFNYSFMDDDFDALYRSEQRMGKVFITFTTLAIIIACLGLFGLAAYAAEQRKKEIGIRKVLGANVSTIVGMLLKDFMRLVIISIVLASPLAWWAMQKWLQDFAYRQNIQWWIFLLAGFAAILIALITISFQAIKAALANPVKSLRSE